MPTKIFTLKSAMRWDAIAQDCYGDVNKMNDIIDANPDVPISTVVAAGTVLNIPVVSEPATTTVTEKLPPWKQ